MPHYIALIHKEPASCYGASFPDVPGVITAADTLDKAIEQATEALSFAAEDWAELNDRPFPQARSLDALRADREFQESSKDAVLVAIPLAEPVREAA